MNKLAIVFMFAVILGPSALARDLDAPGDLSQALSLKWDISSDTWAGVDSLGRALPTFEEAGPPRPNKTVGMFYFLTADPGGAGPYDNTKILAAHPEALNDVHNPAWGPLNSSHYWGEPLFGYYASDDEAVLRKHAQMLDAAGVDVVIFDNSNAVTYDRARSALLKVWERVRQEGGHTPQIAFLCPFGNSNNMGNNTLRALYDGIYKPGLYSDLWFRWQGKPLVLADPSYADGPGPSRIPTELRAGGTLGQTFVASRTFISVGGEFPTWNTTNSGMTLSLYANAPGGALLARRTFANVVDNAALFLDVGKRHPAGRYYLEMSEPTGHIGWWSYAGDVYDGGQASAEGQPAPGDRSLSIGDANRNQIQTLSPGPPSGTPKSQQMRDFFTFRAPIAPYNLQAPPRNQWAWLQIYPQSPQRDATGAMEEVTVGVAQNYNATVNRTAPMSFPGAFGRSFHDGKIDARPDAVQWGFNFDEQWRQARKIDPPFVFVTGWNEWTAGFYDDWAGFHAPPVIFVDEFNEEGSRDIQPMRGGHGDNYYYQLVANVRRYKGVRPLAAVRPAPIKINGPFNAWQSVQPEFRDDRGDPVHRNAPGVGTSGPYVNQTGRNDILAAKVSYDARNIYFYVRTVSTLTPRTDPNWMLLYLNTDGDDKTGWLGYDFVVNRHVANKTVSLERNIPGQYQWQKIADLPYQTKGNQLMLSIPRALLSTKTLPPFIDFKWADNCYAKGDWTDFMLNGDAAPNDRFNFRAKFGRR